MPHPTGAECLGGSQIESLAGFWRSSAASVQFYVCNVSGVCLEGPAAGNAACAVGQQGPLCDVCWDGYFKFSGTCRWVRQGVVGGWRGWWAAGFAARIRTFVESQLPVHITIHSCAPSIPRRCRQCKGNSQARAMLALFARSWEFGGHGPGIMTKVKIFLTHFQVQCAVCSKQVGKKVGCWRAALGGSAGEAGACCLPALTRLHASGHRLAHQPALPMLACPTCLVFFR